MNELLGIVGLSYAHSILLDSNFLLVWLVGKVDAFQLGTWKRTEGYNAADFDVLEKLIDIHQRRLISTPNILTEVFNLSGKRESGGRARFFAEMRQVLIEFDEAYVASRELAKHELLPILGLSDLVTVECAQRRQATVITQDRKLAAYLASRKVQTLTAEHIRALSGSWN